MPRYLMERYRPGATSADITAVIAGDVEVAAEMRDDGGEIQLVSSTFVEGDEVLLSILGRPPRTTRTPSASGSETRSTG